MLDTIKPIQSVAGSRSPLVILFEQQVLQTRNRVYKRVYQMLNNASDAEDITQDTFVRAWVYYDRYDPAYPFEAWVLRIAINLCIDFKRRAKRRPTVSLTTVCGENSDTEEYCHELADSSNDPAQRLMAETIDEKLLQGLLALPNPYRRCLAMVEQDYSYREMADILHCPVGTVRSRIHRAREQMLRRVA